MAKCWFQNIEGRRFGRLIAKYPISNVRPTKWHCVCDCGNSINTRVSSLNRGSTKSCGCLQREASGKACVKRLTKHGHTAGGNSRTYRIWINMVSRCTNPKFDAYPYYGGRGIAVAESWRSFANFLADMGEAPASLTLDRIDSDGNYCKENCQWSTRVQQANNRRNTVQFEYLGSLMTVAELCRAYNLSASLVHARLHRGWSVEKAVDTPSRSVR